MGVYIWETNETHNLPSAYQEVEYLENNGTCYINTGLSIKDGYRSVQKLRFLAYQTSDGGYVTGGYLGYDSGMGNHARLYVGNGQSGKTGWSYGYWGSFTNGTTGTATIGTDYDMDFSWISGNAFLKIDGTSYFSSSSTYTTSLSGPVSVFAGYEPNSPKVHPGLRVYYAKYYDSTDTLVRDLVPCYRKADGVIGMYDLVNDTFYTNSGTGTFTKGNDVPDMVQKELLNAYIGEYAEPTATLDVDFTTLSSLDGFTVSSNGGTQLNSNGLSWQTSSSDRVLDIYHDLPGSRTDAKKVTMTMELYGNYISWGLNQWFDLQNTNGDKGIGGNISFNSNGLSYQGNSIYMLSGTTLAIRQQANPTGTYTYTIEVDLITGEWSGGYTGPNTFSGSGTLTSAQIDEIMQTTRIHVDIRGQQANYNWLRHLTVTIEY